jgi:hypothetical protein
MVNELAADGFAAVLIDIGEDQAARCSTVCWLRVDAGPRAAHGFSSRRALLEVRRRDLRAAPSADRPNQHAVDQVTDQVAHHPMSGCSAFEEKNPMPIIGMTIAWASAHRITPQMAPP